MKTALITGITGQDGSYLAEHLINNDYTVHGIIRRASTFNTTRIDHLYRDPHEKNVKLFLHYGDLTDSIGLRQLLGQIKPDEIYNLGAQSHVKISFDQPEYTANTVAMGAIRLFEAARDYTEGSGHQIKIYQASSSEMFGSSPPPQNELTLFRPRSPYAVSKVAAHYYAINYREAYNMFISNGILFNHESPRRGENFVTRKITRAIGRILAGTQKELFLGNLDASRDWGFAGDYVEAMHLILQHDKPDDFVVATGETHTVREFAEKAFEYANLDYKKYVKTDQRYFRPSEVNALLGNPTKIKQILNWKSKVSFDDLVKMMLAHDINIAKKEVLVGHNL